MKKDIVSISSELRVFKGDINNILSDLQQKVLESSHALERIVDERSLGIAQTKSDVKQLRSELRSCNDSLGLEMRHVNTKFDTSVKQMEKREIHETFQYSHLWQFARTYRHYITHIKAVVQLVAYLVRFDGICKQCSAEHSENFTDHLLLDCTHVASIRNNMYHAIENLFSIDLATALSRLERVQLVKILFGVWQPVLYPHVSDNEKYTQFLFLTYKFVACMLKYYKLN
jgi:hypothetical protein